MPRGETVALSLAVGALHAEAELDGVAWVDLRTGAVLSASARDERSRRALEVAAQAALQLCEAPGLDLDGRTEAPVRETFVVSDSMVQVFAPSTRRPGCGVVGVARGGANVALVLAAVLAVAGKLAE